MSRIIGFSGKIGSGKDEAAYTIQRLHPEYEIKKYAEKLKVMTALLLGVPRAQLEDREYKDSYLPAWGMTVREFLQKFGTDAIRMGLHNEAHVLGLYSDLQDDSKWLITDVRFPNEAIAIRNRGGYVVRIERPGLETGDHPSETALDGRHDLFDAVIHNSFSLYAFKKTVVSVFSQLTLK